MTTQMTLGQLRQAVNRLPEEWDVAPVYLTNTKAVYPLMSFSHNDAARQDGIEVIDHPHILLANVLLGGA